MRSIRFPMTLSAKPMLKTNGKVRSDQGLTLKFKNFRSHEIRSRLRLKPFDTRTFERATEIRSRAALAAFPGRFSIRSSQPSWRKSSTHLIWWVVIWVSYKFIMAQSSSLGSVPSASLAQPIGRKSNVDANTPQFLWIFSPHPCDEFLKILNSKP